MSGSEMQLLERYRDITDGIGMRDGLFQGQLHSDFDRKGSARCRRLIVVGRGEQELKEEASSVRIGVATWI